MEEKLKVSVLLVATCSIVVTRSQVWDVVFEAQTRSIDQMREDTTAASVDIAAREIINAAGYEGTFTHRVGHGIGIKGV